MIRATIGILASQGGVKLLLDQYSGAAAAYSLRLLSSTYTGDAIRVRRSSDNTEQDIGFVSGQLDTSSLETFCSGTDGFVTKWYDQSGNGRDATQTNAANQPQIVSSGSVILENGKPAVQFIATSDTSLFTSTITESLPVHVFATIRLDSILSSLPHLYDTKGAGRMFLRGYFNNNFQMYNGATISTPTNSGITGQSVLFDNLFNSTNSEFYLNGGLEASGNTGTLGVNGTLYLGSRDATRNNMDGFIKEFVFYPSDQSSNRTGIETNINAQYNIYWDGSQTSLLDTYSGSAAAYSLRALSSAYTGPLVRVRRASDNAEQDIYAKYDGSLNVSALEAFCASTNGFVKTWYDQSGNANDATQTTAAEQPQIVSIGSVITENGMPSVQFDGSDDFLECVTTFSITSQSSFAVLNMNSSSDNYARILSQSNNGNDYQSGYIAIIRNQTLQQIGSYTTDKIAPVTIIYNNQLLFNSIHSGSVITNYVNATTSNSASHTLNKTMNRIAIGSKTSTTGGGGFLNGNIQEIIQYNSDQSSNRTGIETNINDFYSIY